MNEKMFKTLEDLVQLDVDAVGAYEEAIEKIEEDDIRERLESYKEDHQRHVDDLSAYLMDQGREMPEQTPDFKGQLIKGFTSLRSVTGTDGALKAMKSNEELTNKKYKEANELDLDWEAKDIVSQNYEDEKIHLAYIEEQLSIRVG